MAESYRGYPGFRQTKIERELDRHLESLEVRGYSILPGVLSPSEAKDYSTRLDALWKKQISEFGEKRLRELKEFEVHRGLMEEDATFAKLVTHPKVLEVVDSLVGSTAILNLQNASASFPNSKHTQSAFHRDFAKDFVATRPLALNAFYCISDFTTQNGATWVVPFSHKSPTVPSEEFVRETAIQMIAPAGSVIFWDSLLLHKAGDNHTSEIRYGVNHMYTRPFLKQQLDFPVYLKGRFEIESRLGQLLGFWSIPPKSVKEYRVDPDKRTYRGGQG